MSIARGIGSTPGGGTKILHAVCHSQKKDLLKKTQKLSLTRRSDTLCLSILLYGDWRVRLLFPNLLFLPGLLLSLSVKVEMIDVHKCGDVCAFLSPSFFLCVCSVTQSCLTLWDPLDCSPPVSSVRGDSLGKDTGVACHTLLRGIFPTQGSNPGLQHCRQTLYRLSHQGSLFLEQHFPKCTRIFFFSLYIIL